MEHSASFSLRFFIPHSLFLIPYSHFRRGFTLVELLVVVAMSFFIAAFFLAPFQTVRQRGVLEESAEQVLGAAEQARALTLAGKSGLPQGVHIGASTITIFSGTTYVPGDLLNTAIELSPLVALSSTTSADVIFQKGTGKTDQQHALTITLNADTTQKRTITIHATGAIQTP